MQRDGNRQARSRRRTAVLVGVAGVVVVAVSLVASRRRLEEAWYIRQLDSESESARVAAIERLGELRSARAIERLVRSCRSGGGLERSSAAVALVRTGQEGCEALLDALCSTDEPDMAMAVRALVEADAAPAIALSFLSRGVQHPSAEARATCAAALGDQGEDALPVLLATLRDRSGAVRAAAASSVARLGRPAAAALADTVREPSELSRARYAAIVALSSMGPDAMPAYEALVGALDDPSEGIRSRAYEVIDRLAEVPGPELEVDLHLPMVRAPAGGAVPLEIRASTRRPIRLFLVHFPSGPLGLGFERVVLDDAAVDGRTGGAAIFNPTFFKGGCLVGADFRRDGRTGFPPATDALLAKVHVRVPRDAGPGHYRIPLGMVSFVAEGGRSLPVRFQRHWDLEVLPERVPETPRGKSSSEAAKADGGPIDGFTCVSLSEGVELQWTYRVPCDSVSVWRGEAFLCELAGGETTYLDPYVTDLLTVYTLRPRRGAEVLQLSRCAVHEFKERFAYRAGDVRAEPGARGVAVPVDATNFKAAEALSVGIRVDPRLARIRELNTKDTHTGEIGPDTFLYQQHVLDTGETAVGVVFDMYGARGAKFARGVEKPAVTILVDIPESVPAGTAIPVELGSFGDPPANSIFTVTESRIGAISRPATTYRGYILVGASPIPVVGDLRAEVAEEKAEAPGVEGGKSRRLVRARGVRISWKCTVPYDAVRVERDGETIAELSGATTSYLDASAGPGRHRYRVYARVGEKESFPVTLVVPPKPGVEVPGDE